MDGDRNAAVLAAPVDFSKAFNRMLHSDILCNLTALNVPKCAVKLIQSYLTNRTMCVQYKGATSSFEKCPGGGPQGGLLTGVLFCLKVNKAGSPCPLPELPALRQDGAQGPAPKPSTNLVSTVPLCHKQENTHKKLFIDDLTLLEKISLSKLVSKAAIIGPPDWHDRFQLTMPPDQSILQHQLHDLVRFTKKHSMVLNTKKTKVFPFISSKKHDY